MTEDNNIAVYEKLSCLSSPHCAMSVVISMLYNLIDSLSDNMAPQIIERLDPALGDIISSIRILGGFKSEEAWHNAIPALLDCMYRNNSGEFNYQVGEKMPLLDMFLNILPRENSFDFGNIFDISYINKWTCNQPKCAGLAPKYSKRETRSFIHPSDSHYPNMSAVLLQYFGGGYLGRRCSHCQCYLYRTKEEVNIPIFLTISCSHVKILQIERVVVIANIEYEVVSLGYNKDHHFTAELIDFKGLLSIYRYDPSKFKGHFFIDGRSRDYFSINSLSGFENDRGQVNMVIYRKK